MYHFVLSILLIFVITGSDFKSSQVKFPRVKAAFLHKEELVSKAFSAQGITLSQAKLFIRVFKKDKQLELWAANKTESVYKRIKVYEVCALSGGSGPKRKGGDGQTPEGFYYIDRYNPSSNFHLSLGINYPNSSDRVLGGNNYLGGDIFIHGNCVTIGCVPLTDDKIEEVYIAAVQARQNGQQKISVHIFPSKEIMQNDETLKNSGTKELVAFWTNIKKGYIFFEKENKLPTVTVDKKGEYIFN